MCGITGIFSHSGHGPPVSRDELLRMRESMLHRGPDGSGIWISEKQHFGLAHTRLAIQDLSSKGAQPMLDKSNRLVLVYNGEIYNAPELRRDLLRDGYEFFSDSDTELLLYLYSEYGIEMLGRLRGMFAFALWDESSQQLLLARDHLGIKPLYFADDGDTLRFASQVKALVAGRGVSTETDPAAIVSFHLWGHIPEPFTAYTHVHSLAPGTAMVIDSMGKKEVHKYFDLRSCYLGSSESAPPDLESLLADSVQSHLIGDVPVSVFQSAGVDSAAISSLAVRQSAIPVSTVTLGFNEYRNTHRDEVPCAEKLAAALGTAHETIWYTRQDFEESLPDIVEKMDLPTIDGINTYFIAKAAAQAGFKVALSGIGGDELFQGYPSFSQIPRLRNSLQWLPAPKIVGGIVRSATSTACRMAGWPKAAGLIEYGHSTGRAFLLRRSLYMPWELPNILDRDVLKTGWARLQEQMQLDDLIEDIASFPQAISFLETHCYLQSRLLRDADWAGMAHSLEIRTPLVDIDVLRGICAMLATEHPPTKLSLASAARIPFSDEIASRPKSGFNVPVREWLLESGGISSRDKGLRGWARYVAGQWGWQHYLETQ